MVQGCITVVAFLAFMNHTVKSSRLCSLIHLFWSCLGRVKRSYNVLVVEWWLCVPVGPSKCLLQGCVHTTIMHVIVGGIMLQNQWDRAHEAIACIEIMWWDNLSVMKGLRLGASQSPHKLRHFYGSSWFFSSITVIAKCWLCAPIKIWNVLGVFDDHSKQWECIFLPP